MILSPKQSNGQHAVAYSPSDGGSDEIGRAVILSGPGMCLAGRELGQSITQMARASRMTGPEVEPKARVHKIEIGARDVSGPDTVAIEALPQEGQPRWFEATHADLAKVEKPGSTEGHHDEH